jgi:hypothetical protein
MLVAQSIVETQIFPPLNPMGSIEKGRSALPRSLAASYGIVMAVGYIHSSQPIHAIAIG